MKANEYHQYLESDAWKERRNACLSEHDYQCQICGCTSWRRPVDVHHLHYRNVGHEKPEDLAPLCSEHHKMIHNQPDGYDEKVLQRLRRECTESYWSDPLPAFVREQQLRHTDFETFGLVCRQCQSAYHPTPNEACCPWCGQGAFTPMKATKEQQDADTLGFTDAKMMDQVKDTWKRVSM